MTHGAARVGSAPGRPGVGGRDRRGPVPSYFGRAIGPTFPFTARR